VLAGIHAQYTGMQNKTDWASLVCSLRSKWPHNKGVIAWASWCGLYGC